ncbi:SRPBCC family protein [Rhodonellum sp.]|uniref:SRPBCC family protein n=1 Tax=Rhodonellum sp. TaxID=2231180 RepID=UPI00271D23B7|nr:SRPBCC family protein [Rhodonellum sp.]MDO9554764.1 SRPBCC family protein [Rhodonellum sp.]
MERILIQATILADRQKVWDYYTLPEHITKWNFATDDWQCPMASNDMRVGGKYSARMEAKDGSFGFDFEGIYDEIKIGEKFTYTLGDGRKVTVAFQDLGDTTDVTINFDPESENSIDLQREGWQAILNNFKKYVES